MLDWLPPLADWPASLAAARAIADPAKRLAEVARLANHRRDFLATAKLATIAGPASTAAEPPGFTPLRVALLSSHTTEHLVPAIRVAGLGRRLALDVHVAPYGQYRQVLLGPPSPLDDFRPDAVLLASDLDDLGLALPVTASEADVAAAITARVDEIAALWRRARARFGATVIQQTILNAAVPLFGEYEGLVPASPFALAARFNQVLRTAARREGVLLLDLDWFAAGQGYQHWADPVRWHQAKQLVGPVLAPVYGDLLARVLAASAGLSRKCLVLDLDNTIWGGVIGDDGLDNIILGQGSASGEAFIAFQRYCRRLAERGVILAVCSKNDEANALEPFTRHPEMHLKRDDITAFVANWDDKARNIREIARVLSIGLDSLVFVDDNPAERAIVRQELPMVAVPELPDDVAFYARRVADAGYFEAAAFTAEDAARGRQYAAQAERREVLASTTDMEGFLRGLNMAMAAGPVTSLDLVRVTQLTNKTNQFNLTTRRYTEPEIERFIADPSVLTLQARLADRFGDNGLIAVIIARPDSAWPGDTMLIDTWLMSCRVLGRQVENAMLDLLAAAAAAQGVMALIGQFIPTAKNALVAEHYRKLGFAPAAAPSGAPDGAAFWRLDVSERAPAPHHIKILETTA